MNTLLKFGMIIACVTAMPLAAAQEFATPDQPHHRPGPSGGEPHGHVLRRIGHALRELDLDEEQRERIRALMWDSRDDLHANMRASADGMQRVRDIVAAEQLDEAALAAAAAEAGRLAEERVMLTGHTVHAVLAELDADQRARLLAMGEERRANRRDTWD